jgi:hypothetical protein
MKKHIKKLAKKANKEKKQTKKFKNKAIEFLGSVIHIFDQDWEHTIHCLQFYKDGTNDYWAKGGTFLEPNIPDDESNWGSRVGFLQGVRQFRKLVRKDKFYKKAFHKKTLKEGFCQSFCLI